MGVLFLNDVALRVFEKHGCDGEWDSKRVRMDRAFVMEQVAKAPSHIIVTPRKPDRTLLFGGRHFNFGQVASPPNVMDLDQGRRIGTRVDLQNFLKLAQA